MARSKKSTIRYPLSGKNVGQFIVFTRYAHQGETTSPVHDIALAAPPGFTIADGAGYGNIDLGVIGSDIGQAALSGDNLTKEDVKAKFGNIGSNPAETNFIVQTVAANNGLGSGTLDKIRGSYGTKNNIAVNPNTVMQFNNTNVRTYSFQFTLVPDSAEEWIAIKDIINSFRESLYPEARANSILLKYPDKWKFTFESEGGNQIPPSYMCFITDMSTSYNTFGNAYHENGVPNDVTIQITLQETKALTRNDIATLSGDGGKGLGRNLSALELAKRFGEDALDTAKDKLKDAIRGFI